MKLKHYIVSIDIYSNQNGYPGLDIDPRSQERFHFSSKEEAKRFMKRYVKSDPEYVRMWVGRMALHTISEKIEMFHFPSELNEPPAIFQNNRDATAHKKEIISKIQPSLEDEHQHVPGLVCPPEFDCDAVRCQNHQYSLEDSAPEDKTNEQQVQV